MMNVMQWTAVLQQMGVQPAQVQAWAPVFATNIDDQTLVRSSSIVLKDGAGLDVKQNELTLFLGQILHESNMLTELSENLNYTDTALVLTFGPSRITKEQAAQVGRTSQHPANQRAIANIVYGGQWGKTRLGNVGPDDGWNYRGSGLIQITGLDNFTTCQKDTGVQFVSNPDLMRSVGNGPLKATMSWWNRHIGNSQLQDPVALRKSVNGGILGIDHCNGLAVAAAKAIANLPQTQGAQS